MNDVIRQVVAARAAVVRSCGALPEAALLPGDRQILGGHLQPFGPALVDLVAAALLRAPARYDDLPVSGAALRRRQAEADAWLGLKTALAGLAQRAADQHLAAQADATRAALLVLDHVYQEPLLPGDRHLARKIARREGLGEARALLVGSQRALRPPAKPKARRPATARSRTRAGAMFHRLFEAERRGALAAPQARAAAPPPAPRYQPASGSTPAPRDAQWQAPAATARSDSSPAGTAILDDPPSRAEISATPEQEAAMADPSPPPARPSPASSAASPVDAAIDQFVTALRGEPAAASAPAAPITTAELGALQGQAAAAEHAIPDPGLDSREIALLQARRSPLLMESLRLLGQAIKDARGFPQGVVSADLCARVVSQDAEIGKVIKAAGDGYVAASAAASARATGALDLGERALRAADAFATDPDKPRAARADVELAFAEAFRMFDEVTARAAAAGRRLDRRLRPLRDSRDEARAATAELRLVDQFLSRRAPAADE